METSKLEWENWNFSLTKISKKAYILSVVVSLGPHLTGEATHTLTDLEREQYLLFGKASLEWRIGDMRANHPNYDTLSWR